MLRSSILEFGSSFNYYLSLSFFIIGKLPVFKIRTKTKEITITNDNQEIATIKKMHKPNPVKENILW